MKKLFFVPIFIFLFSSVCFAASSFKDVGDYKYREAIEVLFEKSIVKGYGDGSFKPEKLINRAEFLKIVLEASGEKSLEGENCFQDVKNKWFAKYVCFAKKKGIVEGYEDGLFKPDRSINYVEALKIIYLVNGDEGLKNGVNKFWFSSYLGDVKKNGISLDVELSHLMTRGEMSQLVFSYMNKKKWKHNVGNGKSEESKNTDDVVVSVNMKECSQLKIPEDAVVLSAGTDVLYSSIQKASAGDVFVLHGGVYKETHELKIDKEDITIMSYPNEWAVIDRSSDTLSEGDSGIWFYVASDGGNLLCTEVIGGLYAVSTETKWDWNEADRSGASNLTIKNCKLHGAGHDVVRIKPNSDNVLIEQNEIYDSGKAYSSDSCNAEGIDNVNADGMVVRKNYIHDVCSTGVYCKGGAMNCLIEDNVIENAGELGISLGFDTSPEYFDLTVNPDMYESIDGIARNNLIVNTGLAGIGLYGSKNSQVYKNTLVNVNSKGSQAALFFGITLQDWDDAGKRPANLNVDVHHNIFSQKSDSPIVSIRTMDDLGGLSGLKGELKISNNCYFRDGGKAKFEDARKIVDFGGGWTEAWSGNLTEWKKQIGGDAGSVEVDPKFNKEYVSGALECAGMGRWDF